MRHYATLFDSSYAAKGLALHDSLCRHSTEPFTLHILAMDHEVFWLLEALQLPHTAVIPLESFELAMHMKPVKESRSWTEYCWTAASSLMEFLLGYGEVDELTYLDSDVFFFADPKHIYDEMRHRSIGITPHHFDASTPKHVLENGTYNVGVVVARNNSTGRQCISRWAAQTREWCFAKVEPTRFGDQKYLDEWPVLYGDECAVLGPGINIGPWAIGQFNIRLGPEFYGTRVMLSNDRWTTPLIAYHFHEFQDSARLTHWPLSYEAVGFIYRPYINVWKGALVRIGQAQSSLHAARHAAQLESERV